MIDLQPLWISIILALIVTLILWVISVPVSFWLNRSNSKISILVEAILCLPLILPPSVLGFYLLIAFSPANALGGFLDKYFNTRLVFTFEGLVIASVIYSLPFMIQPVTSGFRSLSPSLAEASYSLGKSRFTTLWKVLLPNIRSSMITGIIMTFAHTLGEFGVVLMIGGNIPGETRVISIAIYDEVQAMNYHAASVYSMVLFLFTFSLLIGVYFFNRRRNDLNVVS
jgi:molybdate transport system permease protein